MFHLNETGLPLHASSAGEHPGGPGATVVLKGSFRFAPGGIATIADKQRKLSGNKRHMDDVGRSLCWSDDFAPFKPFTDFMVLGSWYAPAGRPVREGRAGFEFGPLSKMVRILGPRLAVGDQKRHNWTVSDPGPIVSLPLRWEFSAGGLRDRRNPFGMGQDPDQPPPGFPEIRMPQIEAPELHHANPGDRHPPVNLAPIPPQFQARRQLLGTRDLRWATFRSPLPPDDYDPAYHNAAPAGQLAGNRPRGDEVLVLHNLHPQHPRLEGRLPGLRPVAASLVRGENGHRAAQLQMELDTIVALPDSLEIVLLWRGFVPLQPDEDDLEGLACRLVPIDASDFGADLLPALLKRVEPIPRPPATDAATEAAAVEKQTNAAAADAAELLAHLRKLAEAPVITPEIRTLVSTETDLDKLAQALKGHLRTALAALRSLPG